MNSLQFPYSSPSSCAIVASLSKVCLCIASGSGDSVLVRFIGRFDSISGAYEIRALFRDYDVGKVIYPPLSKNFVSSCRQGLGHVVKSHCCKLEKESYIEAIQDIQYAYGAGELTFESDEHEKIFRKRMKIIDPKKISIEVEAMLLLFPALINQKFKSVEQVVPSGIYI